MSIVKLKMSVFLTQSKTLIQSKRFIWKMVNVLQKLLTYLKPLMGRANG